MSSVSKMRQLVGYARISLKHFRLLAGGEEWYVAQYLFRRSKGAVGQAPDSARGGAM